MKLNCGCFVSVLSNISHGLQLASTILHKQCLIVQKLWKIGNFQICRFSLEITLNSNLLANCGNYILYWYWYLYLYLCYIKTPNLLPLHFFNISVFLKYYPYPNKSYIKSVNCSSLFSTECTVLLGQNFINFIIAIILYHKHSIQT